MAINILEELQQKKAKLRTLAEKAKSFEWLSEKEYDDIVEKLDNDTLCIGVIGQMKCGKSTFLNSFVFEDDVLPSATTPMTAALSVITYGEQKRIVAEFYTRDEWAEQKMMASRSLDDAEDSDRSKIQAAQELVQKSNKLGSVDQYLGNTQEDKFENLVEYVGADGKFVSITKSVKIYYPKEYLKGVEIVDTPGFNDPIVSREERTKEFLKKADVVLLMLYAGRPFDSTDRDILFKNVKECGIGKVLIGVNKFDIAIQDMSEEQIVKYVQEEIEKSRVQLGDDSLKHILESTTPIPISANMALMSQMSMDKIISSKGKECDYDFAFKRACEVFGITSQPEMRRESHIDQLYNAIVDMINKNKNEILIAKPLNRIIAAGNKILGELVNQKNVTETKLKNLQIPDTELEEKIQSVQKGVRRMNKKITGLEDDIEDTFNNICRKGRNELEDVVDAACKKMNGEIDNWGKFSKQKVIATKLDNIQKYLLEKELPRTIEVISDNSKRELMKCINEFLDEASEVFEDYVEDFDSKSLIKGIKKELVLAVEKKNILTGDAYSEEEGSGIGKGVAHVAVGILFGGIGLGILGAGFALTRLFTHDSAVSELRSKVNDFKCGFNPDVLLNNIKSSKKDIIESVKAKIVDETLKPIQDQLDECINNKADKQSKIKEAEALVKDLSSKISVTESQVNEVEAFKI